MATEVGNGSFASVKVLTKAKSPKKLCIRGGAIVYRSSEQTSFNSPDVMSAQGY